MSKSMPAMFAALCIAAMGCQERIVRYKPFLTGIEGARTQTPAVTGPDAAKAEVKPDQATLVRENPDGTVTLIAKTGRQLMAHIQRTLSENKKQQFTEQVLSEITRGEYFERGLDPVQAFDRLKPYEKEIAKLFSRMPMGEHSPNVIMEQIGRNMFRVKLTGQSKKGLERWTGFDMVLEKGNWRLRWFVT